jgi:hypothetical protein
MMNQELPLPGVRICCRRGNSAPHRLRHSLATLSRLARTLDVEFHIDITPGVFQLRGSA